MKVMRGKVKNYGGFDFGLLRKVSKKKEQTKLMKESLKQLKKTHKFYMVSTTNTYNNGSRQGQASASKRETSRVTVLPRTNNSTSSRIVQKNNEKTCSSRPSNGMKSWHENIKKSMSSSSRIIRKNIDMPRPSSLKPENGEASSQRTMKSSSSPDTGMICLQNDIEKSKASSLRPSNPMDSLNKNTNGGGFPLKTVEKPRGCSLRLNHKEGSLSKNTEMPRSSSSRPNDDMVSTPMSNESLKSRPSRLSNGSSSVLKGNSNSMSDISKESNPSSIVGNSRIAAQMLSGEARKGGIPTTLETSNLSLKLKGKQDDIGASHVSLLGNKEQHAESMGEHNQLDSRKRKNGLLEHGGTDTDKLKRTRMEPLLEENPETHEDNGSEEPDNCRPKKRKRKLILADYEDDDDGDQNPAGVEISTAGLTKETAAAKDYSTKVCSPILSESLKLQQYGSLPIDEPVWSGTINISSDKNISLAAHLSTKCCEKAWKLAESLQQEIVVTKLSRLEAWPKSFEASRPTDDNIALYFLPCEMRQDADVDQLVKEVVENDMVLQAVVGEAEMLIFTSILLPEQHQSFQGKPYMWAVFRRRIKKVATVQAQQPGKRSCAQDEMEEQQQASGLNMDGGLEGLEEVERQVVEQEQNPSVARSNTPSPATEAPTMNATTSANHDGQIHSSMAVPTGALFGFVVQRNSRVEQLIQKLQREGAVVVAMRGEMIGSGLGQAAVSGREEDKMPPSSS